MRTSQTTNCCAGVRASRPALAARAFTLVEMLTVIAIIGVLAALVVSLSGVASRKMREARVRGELAQMETAIEAYQADHASYPPDHKLSGTTQVNSVTNSLFYELVGCEVRGNRFYPVKGEGSLSSSEAQQFFGVSGFVNSSTDRSKVKSYLTDLKQSQFAEISSNPEVEVLTAGVPWPANRSGAPVAGSSANPWRYDASSPLRHNRNSYDLWAQIVVGSQVEVIGNWKQ